MPGPAVFPAIDAQQSASTSSKVIGVLRDTLGFEGPLLEHLSNQAIDGWQPIVLQPYQALWLEKSADPFLSPA